MSKLGENKFVAVKDKNKPNCYLVNVPDDNWGNDAVTILVQGKQGFTNALICEDGNSASVVADGT